MSRLGRARRSSQAMNSAGKKQNPAEAGSVRVAKGQSNGVLIPASRRESKETKTCKQHAVGFGFGNGDCVLISNEGMLLRTKKQIYRRQFILVIFLLVEAQDQ